MVDFSKIFNIVFVSVCAALLLLFLISVIVVAAKGKRKCGVGDVLLRILSTLVLIASAFMVVCSILTMLNTVDGSMCIVANQDGKVAAAWLVMGGEITKLPLPELFVALSSVIGFGLSAVLFILSLTALIVDCLVANKKEDKKDKKGKKKEPAVKKSPEQLKREAELERIRRIGESAVRKTERVAEKAEKTEKDEQSEKTEQPVADVPTADEEPAVDWREQPKEEQHSGFVGLKDETGDDSFDSFDTFDDEQPQEEGGEQGYEQAEDNPAEEIAEQPDEYVTEGGEEYDFEQPEEYAEEQTNEYAAEDGDEYVDEQPTEDIYYDEDEQYTYDDGTQAEEYAEQTEEPADGDYADEGDNYEYADEQPTDEFGEVADENNENNDNYETDEGVEADDNNAAPQADDFGASDIEPDRGIYIPEIRTVTPRPTEKPAAVKKAPQKPSTQRATAKAPRATKPKKSGGTGTAQRPVIPPEKKLPVTRRYVILDRHNAVNMFGEYLKERNQAEKDKLKSSINTIIIE